MTQPAPFEWSRTSREIIRLAAMLDVQPPLSPWDVEDLLHERCVEISLETARFWRHRFGAMFAAEIRKRRIKGMKFSHRRWSLDEMIEKINGERHCLWRSVDHEGEGLASVVTRTRDKKAALKFLRNAMRRAWSVRSLHAAREPQDERPGPAAGERRAPERREGRIRR